MLVLLALLPALTGPSPGHGQELTGVALGPDEAPLANTPVVLHRVGGGGAGFISTDTTDAEGGFRFELDGGAGDIYFAALRYEGGMYIGPAIEAGGEPVTGYLLRVEPASEAGAVASALARPGPVPTAAQPSAQTRTGARAGSDLGALLLVGLLAMAAAAAFVYAAPRYRERRTRDALIQLAEAENALEGAGESGQDEEAGARERARLEGQRDRLRKQLAPRR
jgi:hypothetical protein